MLLVAQSATTSMKVFLTTRRSLTTTAAAVFVGTVAAMASSTAVPDRMSLTSKLKKQDWTGIPLIPIDISPVGVIEGTPISAQEAISKHMGPSGSIAYVIRRPGWVLCREHGQQMTELAAAESTQDSLQGFGMFGIIKETGVVSSVVVCRSNGNVVQDTKYCEDHDDMSKFIYWHPPTMFGSPTHRIY
jgi:hypothetical protein